MTHKDFDYTNEPIVALATPWGRSALAVIRTSGLGTIALLKPSFERLPALSGKMQFGKLMDVEKQEVIDEVMVASFTNGAGYTGEEACEIFCHGNPLLIEKILTYLCAQGFRLALPGEFSYRAVQNGKLDLTQAEAVHELIMAKTDLARQSALTRLSGRLGGEFVAIYERLVHRLGAVEAYLDYPEEELDPFIWESLDDLKQDLTKYLRHEPVGHILNEGALVVLAGEPNVGKSSLFNWLVGSERAIVSPEAGTTRDYIEAMIDIVGYPIRLVDTAGLRESTHDIEQRGIQKSYELVEEADVIIYLTAPTQPVDEKFLRHYGSRVLWVQNKCDEGVIAENVIEDYTAINISVYRQSGLDELMAGVVDKIDPDGVAQRQEVTLLGSMRQKEIVQQAYDELVIVEELAKQKELDLLAFSLRKMTGHFAQLLGNDLQDDAMSAMFKQFCLGK